MLLFGLVFAFVTALPFAIAAFILLRFRVGMLRSMAMVSGTLLALIVVLADVQSPDGISVVAFRFVGTLIVLAPLFTLAWWLGGLGRRAPKDRTCGKASPQ